MMGRGGGGRKTGEKAHKLSSVMKSDCFSSQPSFPLPHSCSPFRSSPFLILFSSTTSDSLFAPTSLTDPPYVVPLLPESVSTPQSPFFSRSPHSPSHSLSLPRLLSLLSPPFSLSFYRRVPVIAYLLLMEIYHLHILRLKIPQRFTWPPRPPPIHPLEADLTRRPHPAPKPPGIPSSPSITLGATKCVLCHRERTIHIRGATLI